jgi:hypothetical protein
MNKLGCAMVLCVILSPHSRAQTPPWPQFRLTTCPAISAPKAGNQRTWKQGLAEQTDFEAISKVQDRKQAGAQLISFAKKYPDSDFRDLALVLAIGVGSSTKDVNLQIEAAEIVVQAPQGEAAALLTAFVTLDGWLAGYALPSDPEQQRKLADLELWTRCGRQALEVLKTQVQPSSIAGIQRDTESILTRTTGFIALQRGDHVSALNSLHEAIKLNPQDGPAYYMLADAEFSAPDPDSSKGVFYLARATELVPQFPPLVDVLKQCYVLSHGSENGLSEVKELAKSNAEPPPGFSIKPPPVKKEHHYATAIAAGAIIGLLVYAAVRNPYVAQGLATGVSGTAGQTATKIIIFGGQNHGTYLGCLSCSQYERDSVFNEVGPYGSRYSNESIWNSYHQFGSSFSPFSSCNPQASDPPVLVDQDGSFYGRLTLNRFHPQIGAGVRLIPWLTSTVCGNS